MITFELISNEDIYAEIISGDKSNWITGKIVKSNIPLYRTFDDNRQELTIYEDVSIFL